MAAQYQRVELGFDLDDFGKPILYSGPEAWVRLILQLAIMAPGTIPSNPTIGVGMNDYDFLLEEDRYRLATEINRQVPIFLPDLPFDGVTVLPGSDDDDNDLLYLSMTFTYDGGTQTVVVAVKKGYHYIDFAIAM